MHMQIDQITKNIQHNPNKAEIESLKLFVQTIL